MSKIKEWINKINSWLAKYKAFNNLVGIIIVTTITILVTLLPFHPAQKSLKLAKESNATAMQSNFIAERSNTIAEKSLKTAKEAVSFTKEEFALQYTPDLRAYVGFCEIRPGTYDISKPGRADDHIIIPLIICNKTYGFAKDINLAMCYNYGGNDNTLRLIIPVLKDGEKSPVSGFAPSVTKGFRELFLEDERSFKMKIVLNWKDAFGKEYNSVENFTLITEKQGADVPQVFLFKSEGFYSDINLPKKDVEKHSSLKIDF